MVRRPSSSTLSAAKNWKSLVHINRAEDGCRAMMSQMSSPLNSPVSPRKVLTLCVVVVRPVFEVPRDRAVGIEGVLAGAHGHVIGVAQGPAGERAGALLDVLLRVVADAHREQLDQLAPVVLVHRLHVVVVVVQEEQHRRVRGERDQQVPEATERVAPEAVELVQQSSALAHVHDGEETVEEQRHLLFQGVVAVDHADHPQLERGPTLVESDGPALRQVLAELAGVPGVEEPLHGRLVAPGRVCLELAAAGPKAGTPHQMSNQSYVFTHPSPPIETARRVRGARSPSLHSPLFSRPLSVSALSTPSAVKPRQSSNRSNDSKRPFTIGAASSPSQSSAIDV